MDDPGTPMVVALQASVSQSTDPQASMNQFMMDFIQTMQANQEANQKQNLEMLEKQRLDTESRIEEQRREMKMRLEQQRRDMLTISKETV